MSICKHGVNSKEASCANCENANRRKVSMKVRKIFAPAIGLVAPLLGWRNYHPCLSCGVQECFVPFHSVMYSEGTGSSVICEGCWRDLSASKRIEYYRRRYQEVYDGKNYGFTWEQIEMAVKYPYYWRNKTGDFLFFIEEC